MLSRSKRSSVSGESSGQSSRAADSLESLELRDPLGTDSLTASRAAPAQTVDEGLAGSDLTPAPAPASSAPIQVETYAAMKQAFEGNSQGRSKNAAYQKILKKLDKAIQLDRQLASNLDAVDDLVSLISEIKELCSDAKSTHWSKQTARNEAIEVLKLALDVKDRELLGLRYENLEKDYGNKTGRIVFRGDGRGPGHFGFDELGADETVFDMWDPDGEHSITQVGATQNMISTSSEHNLPSRYVGFAKQNHNKKTGGRFNFTIYAIYLPANSAILVSEYLEHRKERHEQGEAVGDMTGQDNIGSKELASKVPIKKENILGYRVLGGSSGVKAPQDYVEINPASAHAAEADLEELALFKSSPDMTHTGAM